MKSKRSSPQITRLLSELLQQDIEAFPEQVHSVFGQMVPLMDQSGNWLKELRIEHVGYNVVRLPWSERFHELDYVEWLVRAWLIDRIERRVDLRPLVEVLKELGGLEHRSQEPMQVARAISSWLAALALRGGAAGMPQLVAGARLLYQFALEECLPGFTERGYTDLCQSQSARSANLMVAMRDPDSGPYTSVEIGLLTAKLQASECLTTREKALFLLCRDWGLRPIQLSLLRVDDFQEDELGPYIRVPSVKGIRRSRLRRASSNMVKRHVQDDTAAAIANQIDEAPSQAKVARERLEALAQERGISLEVPMPLFPASERTLDRLERYCESPGIYEYALHADSGRLSREIRRMTETLNVPCQRRGWRMENGDPILITAYRFRRTKGTSLAVAGATLDEIAAALDHAGTASVEHYLRYNNELHDYVNATAAASPTLVEATERWQGRLVEDDRYEQGDATVGMLGRCKRKSPCPYHPTVTCYACHEFRPRRDADHQAALRDIEEQKRQLSALATGAVRTQLEVEIHGARSLILALRLGESDA